MAVSLGSGSVLLVGRAEKVEEWKREESKENSWRTQGLVQMRVIDLDEDLDTQETSCYVHEGPPDVPTPLLSSAIHGKSIRNRARQFSNRSSFYRERVRRQHLREFAVLPAG